MTQPINLRQFRKKKAREDKAKQAEQNRVTFGTPKLLRDLETAKRQKLQDHVDGHARPSSDDPDQD